MHFQPIQREHTPEPPKTLIMILSSPLSFGCYGTLCYRTSHFWLSRNFFPQFRIISKDIDLNFIQFPPHSVFESSLANQSRAFITNYQPCAMSCFANRAFKKEKERWKPLFFGGK